MNSRRKVILIGSVVLGMMAAGAGAWALVGDASTVPSSIVVERVTVREFPDGGATYLDPVDDSQAEGLLAADEALAAFERRNSAFKPADDISAQLGAFTSGGGEGTYRYQGVLAWAFSWHACPPPPPIGPGDDVPASPTPSRCVAWLFLDAKTGEMLEGTYT
jgi:hypothetical protein